MKKDFVSRYSLFTIRYSLSTVHYLRDSIFMLRLCLNIDHIATLREARGAIEPDPLTAAHIAELAGIDGITCHLREDRRHVNDRDVRLLRDTIKTKLDLEMAATPEMLSIATTLLPDLATLVPERREELTTEGGLDVARSTHFLKDYIAELSKGDIAVSLFVDPVETQINASAEAGATFVEIHTGAYANARSEKEELTELEKIGHAARFASSLGLRVNAGHGLNYLNIAPICSIEEIEEVSIGHSIISRAVFVGLESAIREMRALIVRASQ